MQELYSDFRLKDAFSRTYGIDGDLIIAEDYSLTFQALHSETKDLMLNYKNDPAFYLNLFRGSRTFNFQIFYKYNVKSINNFSNNEDLLEFKRGTRIVRHIRYK